MATADVLLGVRVPPVENCWCSG